MKTVYIIIGCDTDPDRASFLDGVPANGLTWRGMLEGIPRVKEYTSNILDDAGHPPSFTWCLRVDEQIRHYYDDYAWVLRTHKAFLQGLSDTGDELAWHPHFWRLDKNTETWFQEAEDRQFQLQMLREAHAAYGEIFPGLPKSVRTGWCYHNIETMSLISDLGVEVEFSAAPGVRIAHSQSLRENKYDWFHTPSHPYHPSRHDYQSPGMGDDALSIIEIPNQVSSALTWGMVYGLGLARKMKALEPLLTAMKKPRYVINVSAEKKLFAPLAAQFEHDLKKSKTDTYIFNGYFHADEMLPNNSPYYSLEAIAANIENILEVARRLGARVEFIPARRAKEIIALTR